jgi:hypothetical protein
LAFQRAGNFSGREQGKESVCPGVYWKIDLKAPQIPVKILLYIGTVMEISINRIVSKK